MIALSAATLVSVMYTVRDMVNPYQGAYNVPSDDMRHVLNVMLDLKTDVVTDFQTTASDHGKGSKVNQ
jgi:hypothetical protein